MGKQGILCLNAQNLHRTLAAGFPFDFFPAFFRFPSFFLAPGVIYFPSEIVILITNMPYHMKGEARMPNCKTLVPFKGTAEQEEKLRAAIDRYKGKPGAVMPVLQEVQEIYGYLPEEVQIMVAEGLDVSLSEIYGVVSFYTQFSVNPKGETQVSVCMGTACYVKGAGDILERVERKLSCKAGAITPDGRFSVDATRCIGACGLAPVMTVGADVYGRLTPDEVDGILEKYINK